MAELSRLEDDLKIYDRLASRLEEASILHSLAQEEGDEATGAEAEGVLAGVESSLEEAEGVAWDSIQICSWPERMTRKRSLPLPPPRNTRLRIGRTCP